MTNIDKLILQARPSLRQILPVVFWQTVVFTIINLAIGIGAFIWKPLVFPVIAPNYTMLYVWGVLFIVLGIVLAIGLIDKRWERLRGLMCVGLFYKILWAIALLFRLDDGGVFLFAVPFIGLAFLQAVIIIFYLPPEDVINGITT